MVFNCTGNITRWIFRAEETGNNNTVFPQMSTWRRDIHRTSVVQFNRISQSGSAAELTGNGPVYEYVLQEPIEVQEGDVLGIELIQMGAEELKFEFLDLGNGSAPLSYHRTFLLGIIWFPPARQDVIWDWQYVPLITAVIGKYLTHTNTPQGSVCMYSHITIHAGFPESTPTFSPTTSTLQTTQTMLHTNTMVSATVSATVSPTQHDVQTGLPVSTIIIISTVIPSTLVLLMLVCTVVIIILIVRRRITRKEGDTVQKHMSKHCSDLSPIQILNVY